MIRFTTPMSSNVSAIQINEDDTVLVEYHTGTYLYREVDEETKERLLLCCELGASAGRTVRRLLHPLPYTKIN